MMLRRISATFRRIAAAALMLAGAAGASAQTDVQLTQFWAMPTYYNAGAAGTTDFLRIAGGARLQWIGIDNAPKGFLGAADMPLKIGKKKIGLGVNVMQESLGLFSNLNLNVQAAYKFRLLKGEFSVGLQAGFFNQKFSGSKVILPGDDDYHESTDEGIPTQDLTGNSFDLSAGVFYTHKYFWAGLSGQHLLENRVTLTMEGSESTESQEYSTTIGRMFYFMAGGNIPIRNTLFELQPSALVKTDLNMFTAEIDIRATYNNFITAGVGYRWQDALSVMVGATYKNFFLGYAYDYPLSRIAKASSGSHEILAGYRLKLNFGGKNKNKHRSIRIM